MHDVTMHDAVVSFSLKYVRVWIDINYYYKKHFFVLIIFINNNNRP